MKPAAGLTPAGLALRRDFEPHRLAAACQARAYEELVPGVDPKKRETPDREPSRASLAGNKLVLSEGAAA